MSLTQENHLRCDLPSAREWKTIFAGPTRPLRADWGFLGLFATYIRGMHASDGHNFLQAAARARLGLHGRNPNVLAIFQGPLRGFVGALAASPRRDHHPAFNPGKLHATATGTRFA